MAKARFNEPAPPGLVMLSRCEESPREGACSHASDQEVSSGVAKGSFAAAQDDGWRGNRLRKVNEIGFGRARSCGQDQIMPRRIAYATAEVLEFTPSLFMMLVTWVETVRGPI